MDNAAMPLSLPVEFFRSSFSSLARTCRQSSWPAREYLRGARAAVGSQWETHSADSTGRHETLVPLPSWQDRDWWPLPGARPREWNECFPAAQIPVLATLATTWVEVREGYLQFHRGIAYPCGPVRNVRSCEQSRP